MTILDEFRNDECRVLDRLVDGELSQADRRALLAALDDEPGAWRRCALAFLESQSWRWQLAQVASEPLVAQAISASGATPLTGAGVKRRNGFGAWLAIAAGLLVAFLLGARYGEPSPQIADVPTESGADLAANESPSAQPVLETPVAPPRSVAGTEPAPDEPTAAAGDPSASTWETLTLAALNESGDEAADRQFEIRVRDDSDSQALQELLAADESALPAALIEQLELEGWQVSRQRQFVPVSLPDGRRMILPVEQLDVHRPQVVQF
jgi:hypothetical protein